MAYYDTIFENAEATIFNGLGENATYFPVDGSPRSIVCLVRRTGVTPVEQGSINNEVTVDICVLNDSSTGVERGTEQVGDRLQLEGDPAEEFYSYRGESGEECSSSGWLTFFKRVNVRTGGNTR